MRSACSLALACLTLPFAVLSTGCASDKEHVEKQLARLREDVTHLQSETDRMGERLDAMETREAALARAEQPGPAAEATVKRPRLKVVRVEPGAELAQARDDQATAGPDADTGPRVVIEGEGKELETHTVDVAPVAAKTARPEATTAPKPAASKPRPPERPKASKAEAAPSP